MAGKSTITVLLFFVVFISKGYGWPTYCEPHVYYFQNIQAFLRSVAPKYGVSYSDEKTNTHPTVLRILGQLNSDRVNQMSALESFGMYTADKLEHYEVPPTVTGRSGEVENLKEIFRKLDAKNEADLAELEQHRKTYLKDEQERNLVLQKVQTLRDANAALEMSINERNTTLSKARETQSNLRKTIIDRGLE